MGVGENQSVMANKFAYYPTSFKIKFLSSWGCVITDRHSGMSAFACPCLGARSQDGLAWLREQPLSRSRSLPVHAYRHCSLHCPLYPPNSTNDVSSASANPPQKVWHGVIISGVNLGLWREMQSASFQRQDKLEKGLLFALHGNWWCRRY